VRGDGKKEAADTAANTTEKRYKRWAATPNLAAEQTGVYWSSEKIKFFGYSGIFRCIFSIFFSDFFTITTR
jgi:hypothetical protein